MRLCCISASWAVTSWASPAGQYDTDRKEGHGIAAAMDFGGKPAARTTECLKLYPACFAGSAAMRPDRSAVGHLQGVGFTAAIGRHLQQNTIRQAHSSGGIAARSNSGCRTPPAGRAIGAPSGAEGIPRGKDESRLGRLDSLCQIVKKVLILLLRVSAGYGVSSGLSTGPSLPRH